MYGVGEQDDAAAQAEIPKSDGNDASPGTLAGQPLDKIEADTDRDRFMTAVEAMEYRLIDKVIDKADSKAG